jgi:MFS transporter, SP family, galactose:H+ symporter
MPPRKFSPASMAILATLPIGLMNVLVGIAVIPLLDRVGRRRLLLISIAGMFFCLLLLSYSMGAPHISRYLVVGAFLAYLAFFEIGLGPVFWLLISEIYPTRIRGKAMSLASITIWASDIAVALTFLTLIDHFGARKSFLLYAIACLAALAFSYYLVPETKGKTLEEIEAGWR